MAKKARSNRHANELRREQARLKQLPLPIEEQHARRDARLAAHAARYPTPPNYERSRTIYCEARRARAAAVKLGQAPMLPALYLAYLLAKRRKAA